MCLSKIDQVPYGDSDIGYKVLRYRKICNKDRKRLTFPYQYCGEMLQIGMTLTDLKTHTLITHATNKKNQRYPTGYHIFTTLEAARAYSISPTIQGSAIVQVRYSDKVASGYTATFDKEGRRVYLPTVVARQMTLIKIIEERG
jgi:hypothetical protein